MATKEEWKEYFELLNDRTPTLAEFQQARQNGEFEGTKRSADEVKLSDSTAPLQNVQNDIQKVYQESTPVSENFGGADEAKGDLSNLTELLKDGAYKDLLSPDKALNRLSLFRLGTLGAIISTLSSILGLVIGLLVMGTITSGIGSYFSNWVQQNSNSSVQYSFNTAQYQNAMSGIMTVATVISLFSVVVGIAWTWFTVYRLKSRQFKGWAIYFLVIGILGALGVVIGLFSNLSSLQYLSALGIKYGIYELWLFIARIISAAVSVIWILVFVKSRKIN